MSKTELSVNLLISAVMGLGAMALMSVDKPMTNFCGLMLMSMAIMVGGYSCLAHLYATDAD